MSFYIYYKKFKVESAKATDWFIKSRKLNGIDKEIALLYKLKYEMKSFEYLEMATKALEGKQTWMI